MNKIKVFISYCIEDNDKMEIIKNLINKSEKLESIVVLQQKSNLLYSADKIIESLNNSTIFLPIITSNSICNQWVNQEIGFVFGSKSFKSENIKPIVENKIMYQLKGFISASNDLNYLFENDEDFEIKATNLVGDLIEKYKNTGNYHIYKVF
jgi:hypothetical protein